MPSYTVKYEENIVTITDRSFKAFSINEREMDIFNKYHLNAFFHPTIEKSSRMKYTAPISITVDKYIHEKMNRHKLFSLIARILEAMSIVEKYDLFASNLILDEKLIFIDELSSRIYMLYRPLNNRNAGGNVYRFLDNLVLKIKKYNGEISDDCDDIHSFLVDENNYKLSSLVNYIQEVYPSIYREIKTPEFDDKSTRLDTLMEASDNDGTVCLNSVGNVENSKKDADTAVAAAFMRLVSIDKSIVIEVNKNSFVIGKSREKADGVIAGNSMISRVHAEILRKDDAIYIRDLGSANGTYVNGNKIDSEQLVQLTKNVTIRLADAEFIIEDIIGAFVEGKNTTCISFYEIGGRKDKLFSFELAKKLSESKKVLYISCESMQTFQFFMPEKKVISKECIVALKTDDKNAFTNISKDIYSIGNLDVVPALSGPLWGYDLDTSIYYKILSDAKQKRIYDYIIYEGVNIEDFVKVMTLSDKAVIKVDDNEYSRYVYDFIQKNISANIITVESDINEEVIGNICRIQ